MRTTKATLACLSMAASLAGCASTMLSDTRIQSATAGVLGQPPASVSISDRRDDGMTNTYYIAHTPRGAYACTINGGGLLAAGMVNAPTCNRQ
jgi:hypothetical protein